MDIDLILMDESDFGPEDYQDIDYLDEDWTD